MCNFIFFDKEVCYISGALSILLLAPFLVKIPVIGIHYWLPKAHVEASTRGSMILAGLLLKLGCYGLIRLRTFLNLLIINWFWLLITGVAGFITMCQSDIKKIIAYRRVVHITLLMTVVSSDLFKVIVITLISLSHGIASIGLFFILGSLRGSNTTRLLTLITQEEKFSWMVYLGGILFLINASIPPAIAFFPELIIVFRVLKESLRYICIFIIIRMSVCYYNILILKRLLQSKSLGCRLISLSYMTGIILSYSLFTSIITVIWLQSV